MMKNGDIRLIIDDVYKEPLARMHADAYAGLVTGYHPLFDREKKDEYDRLAAEVYEQIMRYEDVSAFDLLPPSGD